MYVPQDEQRWIWRTPSRHPSQKNLLSSSGVGRGAPTVTPSAMEATPLAGPRERPDWTCVRPRSHPTSCVRLYVRGACSVSPTTGDCSDPFVPSWSSATGAVLKNRVLSRAQRALRLLLCRPAHRSGRRESSVPPTRRCADHLRNVPAVRSDPPGTDPC